MTTDFEICGTHIPFSEIKDYRIIQREFIYRPIFKEKQASLMKIFSNNKYEYVDMLPYAAIIDENEYKYSIREAKNNLIDESTVKTIASGVFSSVAEAYFLKESVIKDVTSGVVSTVIDKIPFKQSKREQYFCINTAGRLFKTYLDEVPAVVIGNDGRISDVTKKDDIYLSLGDSVRPTILTVPALLIQAKRTYMFFGNRIQLENVDYAYSVLNQSIMQYRRENPQMVTSNGEQHSRLSNALKRFLPNSHNVNNTNV